MSHDSTTTVRVFGALSGKKHGLPAETEVAIPAHGCAARVLACQLDLPLEKVKAVSVNHQIYSLDHCIHPGDDVAFVPPGNGGATSGGTVAGKGEADTD